MAKKKIKEPTLNTEELTLLNEIFVAKLITENSFMRAKGDKAHFNLVKKLFAEKI